MGYAVTFNAPGRHIEAILSTTAEATPLFGGSSSVVFQGKGQPGNGTSSQAYAVSFALPGRGGYHVDFDVSADTDQGECFAQATVLTIV